MRNLPVHGMRGPNKPWELHYPNYDTQPSARMRSDTYANRYSDGICVHYQPRMPPYQGKRKRRPEMQWLRHDY